MGLSHCRTCGKDIGLFMDICGSCLAKEIIEKVFNKDKDQVDEQSTPAVKTDNTPN